ncbi:MAG: IS1595 family transposase, partial [Saprospiraceae bacterium]|nr:IS1595 family transposase [Saprospiraceae bacterium]
YLQLYLDEFCYKLNRRYFGDRLFDRLAIAMSNNYWYNNE